MGLAPNRPPAAGVDVAPNRLVVGATVVVVAPNKPVVGATAGVLAPNRLLVGTTAAVVVVEPNKPPPLEGAALPNKLVVGAAELTAGVPNTSGGVGCRGE